MLGLALYEAEGERMIGFIDSDSTGDIVVGEDINEQCNFLGYEIGEERGWDEEVEAFRKRRKK